MLSCSCECEGYGWWYTSKYDFTPLKTNRRRRCCSCGKLININALCIELCRYRSPQSDIENQIFGDEVSLASWRLCESCGEIYLNLGAIGYCYWAGDDLRENLKDYWDITGFKPTTVP